GLGSSGAAIIAGAMLVGALCDTEIPTETILRYATELEGHADNVAAALYGGWVVHCIKEDGEVLAVKRRWPTDIKVIVVTPHFLLETKKARAVLPHSVDRADAVHNMQRIALFSAALEARADDLLWEAMQDRLHQRYRAPLVPGLAEALATPRRDGLLGLALSGAGPSVLALARYGFEEISKSIGDCFHHHGLETTVRLLAIDDEGQRVTLR
ncbi:MAG: homoserine kinase, partial [Pyrinomonadaceae bacterium]|nr:homoserine kinase [Pyrinomonadaceae bacterium]